MREHQSGGEAIVDPDAELVEAARSAREGDLRAFEGLVKRHQDHVVTNCRYLTRSPDDAPDLAQEVFLKAYFGLARFEGRASFRSWIQRIKLNHCLNYLRKDKGREFLDVDDEVTQTMPEMSVLPEGEKVAKRLGDQQAIQRVLDGLPDTLRVPLLLCDLDGLSYAEIAEELDIGLSATKMRIKRAREEFRLRFAEFEASDAVPLGEVGE